MHTQPRCRSADIKDADTPVTAVGQMQENGQMLPLSGASMPAGTRSRSQRRRTGAPTHPARSHGRTQRSSRGGSTHRSARKTVKAKVVRWERRQGEGVDTAQGDGRAVIKDTAHPQNRGAHKCTCSSSQSLRVEVRTLTCQRRIRPMPPASITSPSSSPLTPSYPAPSTTARAAQNAREYPPPCRLRRRPPSTQPGHPRRHQEARRSDTCQSRSAHCQRIDDSPTRRARLPRTPPAPACLLSSWTHRRPPRRL